MHISTSEKYLMGRENKLKWFILSKFIFLFIFYHNQDHSTSPVAREFPLEILLRDIHGKKNSIPPNQYLISSLVLLPHAC